MEELEENDKKYDQIVGKYLTSSHMELFHLFKILSCVILSYLVLIYLVLSYFSARFKKYRAILMLKVYLKGASSSILSSRRIILRR